MPEPASANVRHLSPADLARLLQADGQAPLLVDVREDYEFEAGHLQDAVHVPLGQLPAYLGTLSPDSAPVFICRSGMRSMSACALALRAGVAAPANLDGGMLRWAGEVDTSIDVA